MKFLGSRPTHQNVNLVKADDSTVHTQNTDQYLDFGGANQVAVADAKDAVAKKHTQGTDTTLGAMTADINMNSHKITGLAAPTTAGDAIRQTTKITEVALETVIDSGGGGGLSLVQNGSFEIVNTNGVPWCWDYWDASFMQDTGVIDGYGGNKAIKITVISGDGGISYTFRNLKPNTTYSVRVWTKVTAGDVAWVDVHGGSSNMDETSTSTTGEYITGTFTTDEIPSDVTIYLCGVYTGDIVWFDALTVIEGSTPSDKYLPALGATVEDIHMNSHQVVGLSAPSATGDAIRQTTKITESALEATIDRRNEGLSLVQNGSFEIVDTNGIPWCWPTYSASFAQDTGVMDGYGGNKAIKITAGADNGGIYYTFRSLNLKPTTTYSLRVWVKVADGDSARIYTTGGSSNMDETSTSTTGEYVTGTFTTDATPTIVNLLLRAAHSGDIVWFDALTVIEGLVPPNRYLPSPAPSIFEFQDFYPVAAAFPGLETLVGTNVLKKYVYALDDTTEEPLGFNYSIPANFDPSGYLMIEVVGFPKTIAADKNVEFTYYYSLGNHDESWDAAYSNFISGDLACINTAKDRHIFRFQKDIYTIAPTLYDVVESKISRTAPSANNLAGDFYFEKLRIWIPRV